MSSILNALRQAPTPTRHFTSLQIVSSSARSNSSTHTFNPEHHPIVLQQLVESLSQESFITSGNPTNSATVKNSISGKSDAANSTAKQGSQTKANQNT
ncbi:hypothetical protein FBU30_000190, partial [Linnemannia zychae]